MTTVRTCVICDCSFDAIWHYSKRCDPCLAANICRCGKPCPPRPGRTECDACYYRRRKETGYIGQGTVHGVSPKRLEEILASQNHSCAVCGIALRDRFEIDHDHACCNRKWSCGKCIRGILCGSCNKGLGLLQEDPSVLRAAIQYIERGEEWWIK